MALSLSFERLWPLPQSVPIAVVMSVVVAVLCRLLLRHKKGAMKKTVLPSPRKTLVRRLSLSELACLPYPPDLFPGARDVDTPYGIMRVYEWGPADGRKVVFIHGDTTPCPMFASIAQGLVDRGCRVMLFDLWGRGYSDTPLDYPHDARLFSLQILFAVASSPIHWTGPNTFALIGFSLGGSIAMSFAGTFPDMVDSIVQLGPAGLIRNLPDSYKSIFIRHPWLAPSSDFMRKLVGRVIGVRTGTRETPAPERTAMGKSGDEPRHVDYNQLDLAAIVQWQYDHHQGFIHSFTNTIRHGPQTGQAFAWQKPCDVIKGKARTNSKLFSDPYSRVLVFLGNEDDVVVRQETVEDLTEVLGASRLSFRYMPGGHGFPYPNSKKIVDHVAGFWRLGYPQR